MSNNTRPATRRRILSPLPSPSPYDVPSERDIRLAHRGIIRERLETQDNTYQEPNQALTIRVIPQDISTSTESHFTISSETTRTTHTTGDEDFTEQNLGPPRLTSTPRVPQNIPAFSTLPAVQGQRPTSNVGRFGKNIDDSISGTLPRNCQRQRFQA